MQVNITLLIRKRQVYFDQRFKLFVFKDWQFEI